MPTRLGEFELLILLALQRLGEDAYGAAVARVIEERTGRSVSLGAVYKTLDRLLAKDFLVARTGEPRPERGGRRRREYRLTAVGVQALETTLSGVDAMRADVGRVVPRDVPET